MLCFYYHFPSIYYLLLHIYVLLNMYHISPLIPFSAIKNMSISVNNSNLISVFFKHACHSNPDADKSLVGSSLLFQCIYF